MQSKSIPRPISNNSYQGNNYQGNQVYIITHAEISNRAIIMVNLEAEAMVMAEVITMDIVTVGPIIEVIITTNTISIMVMMMSTRQINMAYHVHYVVVITTPLNIVLRENTISMILWNYGKDEY